MAGRGLFSLLRRDNDWRLQKPVMSEETGELNNPCTGWFRIYSFRPDLPLESQCAEWHLPDEERLAFLVISLGAYQRRELDADSLNRLRAALTFFRDRGRDLIVRGVYDSVGMGAAHEPALFDRVCSHLRSLAPVIAEFEDVVFVYQGVLLGSWGEMHSSRFLTKPRLKILMQILEQGIGERIFLAVRRPVFYRMLRSEKNERQECRLGLFDDAVMGSETDLGTFGAQEAVTAGWEAPWLPEEELRFEEKLCRTVPQGGEALLSEAGAMPLSAAVKRLQRMRISYLNSQHDPALLAHWKQLRWTSADAWNGVSGYDYIGRHLGYRFRLRSAGLQLRQDGLTVQVTMDNAGFAPCYFQTAIRLLQETSAGVQTIEAECDLRQLCGGESRTVSIPVSAETSDLYLQLYRCSDGRIIRFGTVYTEKTDKGLFLGRIEPT